MPGRKLTTRYRLFYFMDISEKNIEDLIYENLTPDNVHLLAERGLPFDEMNCFERQVNLGPYGILDLIGLNYYRSGKEKILEVFIIEIKKGEINIETYIQAIRYCKGIQVLLSKTCLTLKFNQILIGTSIKKNDFIYLTDINEDVSFYIMKLSLEKGIYFNRENGYRISNSDFNLNPTLSDKFITYLKSQVEDNVLEDINARAYFKKHSNINEKEN